MNFFPASPSSRRRQISKNDPKKFPREEEQESKMKDDFLCQEFCKYFLKSATNEFFVKLKVHKDEKFDDAPTAPGDDNDDDDDAQSILTTFLQISSLPETTGEKKLQMATLQQAIDSLDDGEFSKFFLCKMLLPPALEIWHSYERQFASTFYIENTDDYADYSMSLSKQFLHSSTPTQRRWDKYNLNLRAIQKLAQFSAVCCANYLMDGGAGKNFDFGHPHKSILSAPLTNHVLSKYWQRFGHTWLRFEGQRGKKEKLSLINFFQFPVAAFRSPETGEICVDSGSGTGVSRDTEVNIQWLRRPMDFEWDTYERSIQGQSFQDIEFGKNDYFTWTDQASKNCPKMYAHFMKNDDLVLVFEKIRQILTVCHTTLEKMRENSNLFEMAKSDSKFLKNLQSKATLLDRQGQYKEALEIFGAISEFQNLNLGPHHTDFLSSRSNLAAMLDSLGQFESALEVYGEVWEVQKSIFGADARNSLTTQNNMAFVLQNIGRFGEALEIFEKVLEVEKKLLGPTHPDCLTTENNMAAVLQRLGDFEGCEKIYEKVYQIRKKILGPGHPQSLTTRNNLASVLCDQGRFAEALEVYKKVYEIGQNILDKDHPFLLTTLQCMAISMRKMGEVKASLRLMEKVYQKSKISMGSEHSLTVSSQNFIGKYASV